MPISNETMQRELGKDLNAEANELFRLGESLHRSELYEPAAQQYVRFLEMLGDHPARFAGHWNLADCLHHTHQFEAAMAQYDLAHQLRPEHAEVLADRALSLAALGRMQESVDSLRAALGKAEKPDYRRLLGFALFDLGHTAEAAAELLKVGEELDFQGWARAAVGQHENGQAEASSSLEQARKRLQSDDGDGWARVGVLLASRGHLGLAQPFLEEALRRAPSTEARERVLEFTSPPADAWFPWTHLRLTALGRAPKDYLERPAVDKMGRYLAFVAEGEEAGVIELLVNGQSHRFTGVSHENLCLSSQGGWALAVLRSDDQWWVERSTGPAVGPFEDCPLIRFSADGARLAIGCGQRLWLDGNWQNLAGELRTLVFSRDGSRVATMERIEDTFRAVLDGQPLSDWEGMAGQCFDFSPDGRHFAYIGARGGGQCVVLDEKPGKFYQGVAGLVFSADSQHLVHWANGGEACCAVLDGKEGEWLEEAGDFQLDDAGRRLAFHGRKDGSKRLIDNGRVSPPYDDVYNCKVNPAGDSLACFVQKGSNWFCLIDGRESPAWQDVSSDSLVWNPVHRRWVYVVTHNYQWCLVEGEQVGRGYDAFASGAPQIAPSGHVLYGATRNDNWVLVAGGHESEPFNRVFTSPRLDDSTMVCLVVRDGTVYRAELNLRAAGLA